MKLQDVESKRLLPIITGDDQERLSWACEAFDDFIKGVESRRIAFSAPYSLRAIEALNDAELQAYYEQFGLATYYPDLARASRNMMMYNEQRMFRRLGTKAAIEAMIQYIFGDNPISLEIIDNLAFDSDGQLIDESLLNLYDANITVQIASLDSFQLARIFENITKFNRDTQQLRHIVIRYESEQTMHMSCIENDIACIFYDSQVMCEWYHTVSLFNAIDTVTGEETQFNAPPSIETIDKGGSMFTSPKQLVNIETPNNYETLNKGGDMFTSNKQLVETPIQGIDVIDNTGTAV